ncbi:MAG: acetyl-CoA carboxylase biotin carboxyl carrier protein, partial [Candidatus Latescibacterota bacterium]
KPGSAVKAGATVCIVEAMKLINEIKAPDDCEILEILVNNGESVDKGQPLILVKKL